MFFNKKSASSYLTLEWDTVVSFNEDECYDGIVRIPSNVTTIGNGAFENQSFRAIVFASYGELTEIQNAAFCGVWHLKEVVLPSTLRHIGDSAFADCRDLESIYIPDSVQSIGYGAFSDCKNLREVRLPSGLTEISAAMFERCYNLRTLHIPPSVKVINGFAFSHSGLESLRIPSTVRNIAAQHLFAGCNDLRRLMIPSGFSYVIDKMEIPSGCRIEYV